MGTQLAEVDHAIEAQLNVLQVHDGDPAKGKKRGRARNAPKFDLRTQLFRMCAVDLTRIDGIDVTTALAVISETGPDMSRFPSVKHFTSWLGLCPGTKITGGKAISGKTKRCANRAAQALRLAAAALRSSQSALGAYFRRLSARMDKPKAVTAAAHKLARLIYTMLTKGEEYTDQVRITTRSATASGCCTNWPSAPRKWVCGWSPLNRPLKTDIPDQLLSGSFLRDLIARGSYECLEIGLSDDPDSMAFGDKLFSFAML